MYHILSKNSAHGFTFSYLDIVHYTVCYLTLTISTSFDPSSVCNRALCIQGSSDSSSGSLWARDGRMSSATKSVESSNAAEENIIKTKSQTLF